MFMTLPHHYFITHNTIGSDAILADVGDMSVELALWLEYSVVAQLKIEKEDGEYGRQMYLKVNLEPYTLSRCIQAGSKYNPKLSDQSGYLTPLGIERGMSAHKALDLIREYENNLEYNEVNLSDLSHPHLWTDPQQAFLQMTIERRSVEMLSVIDKAISSVTTKYTNLRRDELIEMFGQFKDFTIIEGPERHNSDKKDDEINYKKDDEIPQVTVPKISLTLEQLDEEERIQNFVPRTTLANFTPVTYVPTVTFGSKAKRDLTDLIKYGLVDVKYLSTPGRGRSKRAISVSPVGRLLVNYIDQHTIKIQR